MVIGAAFSVTGTILLVATFSEEKRPVRYFIFSLASLCCGALSGFGMAYIAITLL
jgi:hypothetical protein